MKDNSVVIVLSILLVFLCIYKYSIPHRNIITDKDKSIYFDVNLKNICSSVSKKTTREEQIEEFKKLKKEMHDNDILEHNKMMLRNFDMPYKSVEYTNTLTGDDQLVNKMIHMSSINKRSIENRAKLNKHSVLPYLESELQSHEASVWWDDETLENEF